MCVFVCKHVYVWVHIRRYCTCTYMWVGVCINPQTRYVCKHTHTHTHTHTLSILPHGSRHFLPHGSRRFLPHSSRHFLPHGIRRFLPHGSRHFPPMAVDDSCLMAVDVSCLMAVDASCPWQLYKGHAIFLNFLVLFKRHSGKALVKGLLFIGVEGEGAHCTTCSS